MIKMKERKKIRQYKHKSVRKKISGTAEKPRMAVYRSLQNIYVQLIDDNAEKTLLSCSTLDKNISEKIKYGGNKEAAKLVGEEIAKRALAAGITSVVFDRAGLKFHGRIKELAEAARKAGLNF
ncbi:MAG TPA: 50S ribosomal protein L18 [bacterium]|nr:50S ribosomal protein L18 [bacterium]HPP86856.1 50S ribosomal protein L18 [bacterium]